MKKFIVPYADTGYFSKPVIDYLKGAPALQPFYHYPPDRSSFAKILHQRNTYETHRDNLHHALVRQHEQQDKTSMHDVFQNIEALKHEKTFTVTTAHQPNLFLGPLYLVYKIVSAINLAKELRIEFPTYHFVPVYWMGSEDHDKEELNHIHVFGKTIEWKTDQQGAFGRMKTESLSALIDEIKDVLGNSEQAKQCIALLEDCYLKEETIAAATKKILYHFFAKDGLVIVDGDDEELKRLFIPVIKKELLEQFSFPIVQKSNEEFSESYTSQITPREINLFYLDEGVRQRIVKEGDHWKVLNTSLSFSQEELLDLIDAHPEKFSPNVVLRPIYQETVLPNIAFIGGGAEITYWLQLKPLFDSCELSFPIVMLRNSALLIDSGNAIRMRKLNISAREIFLPIEDLIKNFIQQQSGDLVSLEVQRKKLDELMELTLQQSIKADPTLKGAVEAERVRMHKSLEALEEKLRKAAKKSADTSVQQIVVLKDKLFPENGLQERYDNFLSWYSRYGDRFLSELESNFDPFDHQFTVLLEE